MKTTATVETMLADALTTYISFRNTYDSTAVNIRLEDNLILSALPGIINKILNLYNLCL